MMYSRGSIGTQVEGCSSTSTSEIEDKANKVCGHDWYWHWIWNSSIYLADILHRTDYQTSFKSLLYNFR